MATDYTICMGTVGAGIWYSPDRGEHWNKSRVELPYFWELGDIRVYAMAASPHQPHRVMAGSEMGLHVSDDNGRTWQAMGFPIEGRQVWSIAYDPADRDVIFVGTKPAAVFRSIDGGRSWEQRPVAFPERCPIPIGPPRVTALVVDPANHRSIWAGAEVGGVFHSVDGGDSWQAMPPFGDSENALDIHGAAISTGREKKVLITTPDGIWSSRDEGQSWSMHGFEFPNQPHSAYTRAVAVSAGNPEVIFVGNGNMVFGDGGLVQRSRDGGQSWETLALPVAPNSAVYGFATNPADPNVVIANTFYGYIYLSENGGDSWRKLPRELTEIRSQAWLPN
ncbi:MAG TPA: YCF48-related protein [Candidatus Binataceae bacterium]|nr:YCF48-related protein [Candidatus Binataceae bacterium]